MSSTFQGTLVKRDLGPGTWVLRTDDGDEHPLHGDIPADLAGERVSVEGQRLTGQMGIGMTGADPIAASAITKA